MARKNRKNRPDRSALHVVPPVDTDAVVEAENEDEEDLSTPRPMTLLEATEALAVQIRGICQRTKLSENTVLSLFSFQFSQIEKERQQRMMEQSQGQAAVDAIAAEQAAQEEPDEPREADEVVTADD